MNTSRKPSLAVCSSDLSRIIERLEKAEEPSAELDHTIATQVDGWRYQPFVPHNFKWHDGKHDVPGPPPAYTRSLDAAVALCERVLPGWTTDVHTSDGSPETYPVALSLRMDEEGAEALLSYQHPKIDAREIGDGAALTLPLALCLAICRALLSSAEQTADDKPGMNTDAGRSFLGGEG